MSTVNQELHLGDRFGPVRDQGARPTCLVFAVSDLHASMRANSEPLSCEFLFYHAQRRASRPPTLGATLPTTLDALRQEGQPRENGWPYLAAASVNSATWQPPPSVGALYRRSGKDCTSSLGAIVSSLNKLRPLVLLIYLSRSFYLPSDGALVDPPPSEQPELSCRHAVVAFGHGTHEGKQVVLVRNSWGVGWANGGCAWLTEGFLSTHLFGLAILRESADVTSSNTAA